MNELGLAFSMGHSTHDLTRAPEYRQQYNSV